MMVVVSRCAQYTLKIAFIQSLATDKLVKATRLAEGLKETVAEGLGLALFITRDVFPAPRGEFGEFFPARHGGVLHDGKGAGNLELSEAFPGNGLPENAPRFIGGLFPVVPCGTLGIHLHHAAQLPRESSLAACIFARVLLYRPCPGNPCAASVACQLSCSPSSSPTRRAGRW
jgi:hypothetical protein